MLSWKQEDDCWLASGFRVHQVAKSLWSLEYTVTSGSVDTSDPIAQLRTLEACQRTAQRLHEDHQLKLKRQGLAAAGVGSWSIALITGDPLAFIVGGVLGTAALLELIATWFEDRVGRASEYIQ